MTIRQYFAAMAMQALLASEPQELDLSEEIAADAVRAADALIAELEKEKSNV